jgi:hypothetical protein
VLPQRSRIGSVSGAKFRKFGCGVNGRRTDVKKLLLATAIAMALAAPAYAQNPSTDPYAEGQRQLDNRDHELAEQNAKRTHDQILKDASTLANAAYCKVVDSHIAELLIGMNAVYTPKVVPGEDVFKQLMEAKKKGEMEAQANDCAYWKEHPESVRAMRNYIYERMNHG